jgi:hypothetical protein
MPAVSSTRRPLAAKSSEAPSAASARPCSRRTSSTPAPAASPTPPSATTSSPSTPTLRTSTSSSSGNQTRSRRSEPRESARSARRHRRRCRQRCPPCHRSTHPLDSDHPRPPPVTAEREHVDLAAGCAVTPFFGPVMHWWTGPSVLLLPMDSRFPRERRTLPLSAVRLCDEACAGSGRRAPGSRAAPSCTTPERARPTTYEKRSARSWTGCHPVKANWSSSRRFRTLSPTATWTSG